MFKSVNRSLVAFIAVVGLSSVSLSAESESSPAVQPESAPAAQPESTPAAQSESKSAFEGEIEIGGIRVDADHDSAKFREYRGIAGDSTYFIGNVDLSYNRDAYYIDLIGKDLGLNTRNIRIDSGIYGRYNFFLEYDETPKFISENSRTIFNGAGGDKLTLPAGYDRTAATTAAGVISGIGGSGNLKDVDLEFERKSATAGFSVSTFRGLVDFKLSAKHEEKEGIKSIGAVVQGANLGPAPDSGAGVRETLILPEPVDYVTDELKASIAYTRPMAQLELAYLLSIFNNDKESLTWENPYRFGASDPVISLPPDNTYHRWTLSGGLNMPLNTRLSLVGEYGKMRQDEDLLPYHADPAITAYGALPRSSADAEIETKLLNVNLSAMPISPLFVNAKYRHYETVNNTPNNDLFTYAMADGETPGTPITTPTPKNRYNQPFDYVQDKGTADISYRLLSRATLNVGYDQDIIHRDERERDRTQEDTYKAGLRTNLSIASAGVSYLNGKRRGDTYNGRAILDSHPDTTSATVPDWVNHPDLRKMDIADRDREKIDAFLTILPSENISVGANYSSVNDEYPETDGFVDFNNTTIGFIQTQLGLQESSSQSYTVDASYTASENFTIYTYYTNELGRSKELGRQMGQAGTTPPPLWDRPEYNWTSTIRDKIDTVGVSSNISLMKGKLTIIPEYTYARSKTEIDIWGGSAITGIMPLPDLRTERHTFNLTGKYKLTDNVTLGASYLYESYTSDDWATDGMTLDNTATLPTDKAFIPLSESEPNYVANAGSITVAYKW